MERHNRNKQTLDLFVQYCNEHPEYRFWQALTNFIKSRYIKILLIPRDVTLIFSPVGVGYETSLESLDDPYGWEYRFYDGDHPETINPPLKGATS